MKIVDNVNNSIKKITKMLSLTRKTCTNLKIKNSLKNSLIVNMHQRVALKEIISDNLRSCG